MTHLLQFGCLVVIVLWSTISSADGVQILCPVVGLLVGRIVGGGGGGAIRAPKNTATLGPQRTQPNEVTRGSYLGPLECFGWRGQLCARLTVAGCAQTHQNQRKPAQKAAEPVEPVEPTKPTEPTRSSDRRTQKRPVSNIKQPPTSKCHAFGTDNTINSRLALLINPNHLSRLVWLLSVEAGFC